MKLLETEILNFDNWLLPWTFHDSIIYSLSITYEDKELFKTIWATAIDSSNWKNSDLVTGRKVAEARLSELYRLSDNAIANIVRAASYEWR